MTRKLIILIPHEIKKRFYTKIKAKKKKKKNILLEKGFKNNYRNIMGKTNKKIFLLGNS
jgi:hypothetical protein